MVLETAKIAVLFLKVRPREILPPPTLPAGDEFALFMNAALLGLKERGVEVMTTPASDGWGMSAIKGQRLIEVAVGDTPEAAARDLFLRLILKGIK